MQFVPARLRTTNWAERPTRYFPSTVQGGIGTPYAVHPFGRYHTRLGSGHWIRLGFIVPWEEEIEEEPTILHDGCESHRLGLPCRHHHVEPKVRPRPRRRPASQLRYPLFGREVDYGRNQWEYHAYDVDSDVRIPVGVERNQVLLQNGDLVQLLGDPQLWAVLLTELY